LEKTKEFLETLFEYAPTSYYINDLKGNFLDGNIAAEKLTGYKKDELVGNNFLKLNLLQKKDIGKAAKLLVKNLLGQPTGPDEFTLVRKDGSEVIAEISTRPVKVGRMTYVLGIARDITELKKTQENLRISKIEAENSAIKAIESDRAKSQFLANMSHEIRTPMNAILGFSELLKDNLKDPNYLRYVDIILSSGKTLLELINDILDLSKIEADKLEIKLGPVNPKELFSDIAKIFSSKIDSKGLKFITKIDESLPSSILIDEVRVRQVLFNLVGNAVKFTPGGFIELAVEGRFYNDRSKIDLIFTIKDTGIGISKQDVKVIFDAFRQSAAHDTKKYGGTGLGLAITKRLVELMGGSIDVDSTEGKGSIFKVLIKNVAIATVESGYDLDADSILNVKFKNQKVLVADDVESNRLLINKILGFYNLQVVEAINGKEAVNIAQKIKPDIILMDLRMPVMDGYKAIEILKSEKTTSEIPIIILTASVMRSEEKIIKNLNCEGYVRKPVSRAELINELEKYLEHDKQEKLVRKTEKERDTAGGNNAYSATYNLNKKTSKENILPEDLYARLNGEIYQKLEKLKKEFIINDIEDFAKEIKDIGTKYKISSLIEWADKLQAEASGFDFDNLSITINNFNSVIANL
jgi:PAS domain S-box-containing protein